MEEIKERLLPILGPVLAVILAGVLGYHFIEGWDYFDSLYMTVITLATVGYGETNPLNGPGRAFTICLIVFGIGVLTYAISTLTAFIVEGELKDVLRRRRMENRIAKLTDHYIVCGAGRTGYTIMSELQKTARPFVVIDKSPEKVEALQTRGVYALQGDATTDDSVLIKAGVERARGLFGTLPDDPDNAFVAISARGLSPGIRVVCRAMEAGAADKLRRSGADAVVNPNSIGGLRMASEMIRPAAVDFLDSMLRAEGKVFRIEEVRVPEGSPLKGEPLGSMKGGDGGDCALVLAVKHPQDKAYAVNPDPSRVVEAGDILVAMGSLDQIQALRVKTGG